MKRFTCVLMAVAAGALGASLAGQALPASASTAAHVPSSLGPGWTQGELKGTGGGCAVPATGAVGAKVISDTCGTFTWYWRSLGTVPNHGPELEFVDPSGSYALTHTSAGWVTAKPSDSSTFVVFDTVDESGGACPVQTIGGIGMYPNGKGLQLKTTGSGVWSYPIPS